MQVPPGGIEFGADGGAHFVGSGGEFGNADTRCVTQRVQNWRGGGGEGLLTDPFCAKRADGRNLFDENRFDLRNIANGGNQVIVQIFTFARHEFFHQRHAEALRDAAFDLAFDQSWVNSASHVVGGSQLQNFDSSEFEIDFDFGEMRAEPINGIGNALAILIERLGGRIVGDFGAEDITEPIERKIVEGYE